MQDIDFDELDRAVSSLIGDAPAAKPDESPKTEPAVTNTVPSTPASATPAVPESIPVSINVAVNTTPAPTPAPVIATPTLSATPAPAPAPSNIVTNRPNLGRSMDMVRPIGNNVASVNPVKTAAPLPNPSEIPSRKSMVISPISLTELPPTNNPADRNNNQPVVPIGGAVVETSPIQNNQQDSPFIPDVKVDKRPLGGSIEPDMPEPTKEQPPVYASAITPGGFINEKAEISTDMPLPAELQNKLLEIEAAESSSASQAPIIPEAPLAPVTPDLKIEDSSTPTQPVASPVVAEKTPEPIAATPITIASQPAVAAPTTSSTIPSTSISQQYANTTADNMSLKTTGAIYDTSAFNNKSNIKPAKKKSSAWVWILTVVLILIAVAIGVAIFYVVR